MLCFLPLWNYSFPSPFGSNILQAGDSHLGGFYYYRPRPVCVALLPEHHAEFVCGRNLTALEQISRPVETAIFAMGNISNPNGL